MNDWLTYSSSSSSFKLFMKSMTDLYNYLIIFLYYQLIFQFVKCDANLAKLSSTGRPCQIMWPLTVADSYKESQLHFSIDASFMCNSHKQNWVLMVANVILLVSYCLSFHSYLALINYSHPLTNEIIGMFCRVSAWTPAFINRESSFISVWKTCARWYVVRSIAFSHIIAHWIARK